MLDSENDLELPGAAGISTTRFLMGKERKIFYNWAERHFAGISAKCCL